MPPLSGKSALVVGVSQSRRLEVSDRLRQVGAVVVEAMTVLQAEATMQYLGFELVFVDFLGAGDGLQGFLARVRSEDPESRVFVIGPPVDYRLFGRLRSPDLANLGFGNAPDSIGEAFSSVRANADDRKVVGDNGAETASPRPRRSNGRQK